VCNLIRSSTLPRHLVGQMYDIVTYMSNAERGRLKTEEAFLGKVRELRYQPLIGWEGDTWNGLDEILRVLKDSGPFDFRRIY